MIDQAIMDGSGAGGGRGGARGLSFKQKAPPRRPSITPPAAGGVQLEIAVSCR